MVYYYWYHDIASNPGRAVEIDKNIEYVQGLHIKKIKALVLALKKAKSLRLVPGFIVGKYKSKELKIVKQRPPRLTTPFFMIHSPTKTLTLYLTHTFSFSSFPYTS